MACRQDAFNAFSKMGIPTIKHEEWKYTRISSLFNKEYQFQVNSLVTPFVKTALNAIRFPVMKRLMNCFLVNGFFSFPLSDIRSNELIVLPLEEAATNKYKDMVAEHFGHSSHYLKDGINALNTAFVTGRCFYSCRKGAVPEHPVYIYNITDARSSNVFHSHAASFILAKTHRCKW